MSSIMRKTSLEHVKNTIKAMFIVVGGLTKSISIPKCFLVYFCCYVNNFQSVTASW